jgi:hypothetical protein
MDSQPEILRFIFVAGIDWAWSGVGFATKVARDRVRQVLAKYKERHIQIQIFDFSSGSIHIIERGRGVTASIKESERQIFAPITKKLNYPRIEMSSGPSDSVYVHDGRQTMSITDVYESVFLIGDRSPETLCELSFFSHAYSDGPTLVNSYEYLRPVYKGGRLREAYAHEMNARDSFDRDPRGAKDFDLPYFNKERHKSLNHAFHRKLGRAWIWGCNDDLRVLYPLQKTFQSPSFSWSGVDNEKVIKYRFTKEEAQDCFGTDPTGKFLPQDKSELIFSRTFGELKKYARAILSSTYSARFARTSKVLCLGALPGTFANYQRPPMAITSDRKSVTRFFKTYLSVSLDDDGFGYAKFFPEQ